MAILTFFNGLTRVFEDVEKLEPSYVADENVKLYSHFGKEFNNFL